MQRMVQEGEVDALVPERVWQELARGLMEHKPSRMFEVLRACGALQRILPELAALWGVPQPEKWHPEIDTGVHVMLVVDWAAAQDFLCRSVSPRCCTTSAKAPRRPRSGRATTAMKRAANAWPKTSARA
jgi:tRNA nucleotidyltransferase/poly(A) polymerase